MNRAIASIPTNPRHHNGSRDSERIRDLELKVAKLEAEKRELEALARVDALTGLGNRRAFEDALDHTTRYVARFGGPLSLISIDLDGMKALNDAHGHPMGDAGLRAVGELLRDTLRATDIACRQGGDEFAVLLPGTAEEGALLVAEKVRHAIATLAIRIGDALVRPFTASVGVATLDEAMESTEGATQMVHGADQALYYAKRAGKNRVMGFIKKAA